MAEVDARHAALAKTMQELTKRYGEGAVMVLGDAERMQVECISTGSLTLDLALGGGVPRGRIVEIYGPESSGKTTLCLHIIAEAQRMGGTAAFIDMEHALDPAYAGRLGVDIGKLLVSQPDTGEQAMEICEALVRSGSLDVVGRRQRCCAGTRQRAGRRYGRRIDGYAGPPHVTSAP